MKNLKKKLALVCAFAMTFAMGTTALAAVSPTASVQNATVLDSSAVTVPSGSSVVISGITEVPSSDASRASLITTIDGLGMDIQKVVLMEINATGSGEVTFNVGTQYAGKTVVCEHFNTTTQVWEKVGSATVDANGNVTFKFTSFSPVALVITTETSTSSDSSASTSSSSTTSTSSTTSPKTGENNMIYAVELLAFACVATLVVAGRKVKHI